MSFFQLRSPRINNSLTASAVSLPDIQISVSDTTTLTETVVVSYPVGDLYDDFNDNSQATALWLAISGTGKELETNWQLQVSSTLSATTYAGYKAVRYYDLTGSRILSQVIDAGNQSIVSWQAVPVLLFLDALNSVAWYISNGKIVAQKEVAGAYTDILATTTYDSTIHKFFSLRESAGTVFWDFSTDGLTWTNYTSQASPIPVNHVQPEVIGGAYSPEVVTTTAIFDNFNIIRDRFVTISDGATSTESVTTVFATSATVVSVADTATVTDTIALQTSVSLSVSDSTTVADTPTVFLPFYALSANDSSTITETVTLVNVYGVSVSDSTALTETLKALVVGRVNVSDSTATSESLSVTKPVFISVSDTAATTDTVSVSELVTVSVSDIATESETITLYENAYFISVADSTVVSEVAAIYDGEGVFVTDNSSATETLSLVIPALYLSIGDSSTISETISTPAISYGVAVVPTDSNYTLIGIKVV